VRPEIAGCSPGCTVCGSVCPTGAIRPFTAEDKLKVKQGTAVLEKGRCIGWTENRVCNECVKACPTQAIKVVREQGIEKPSEIIAAECIGCGICVERCYRIVKGESACTVNGSDRGNPTDFGAISRTLDARSKAGKVFLPWIHEDRYYPHTAPADRGFSQLRRHGNFGNVTKRGNDQG